MKDQVEKAVKERDALHPAGQVLMSDAYRTSGFTCPSCPDDAPLREFNGRLICDVCDGMLLADEDFATSIHELDGSTEPVVVGDPQPADKRCPRCQPRSRVVHGRRRQAQAPRPPDALRSRRLVEAARHADRRVRRSRPSDLAPRHRSLDRRSLDDRRGRRRRDGARMSSISQAFGSGRPASAGLAISEWGSSRPMVHTLFVSAYKDRTLGCPSCKENKLHSRANRWSCDNCAGSFVEDAALEAMVSEMTKTPVDRPTDQRRFAGDRHCPVCDQPMLLEILEA